MKKILLGIIITLFLATGCAKRISVTRMGIYPAKPDRCEIEVKNIDMAEANQSYKHIGLISVSGHAKDIEIDEDLMTDVKQNACKMGGEMISLNAQSVSGTGVVSAGITQFNVWIPQ